jgi:hypothetical protein
MEIDPLLRNESVRGLINCCIHGKVIINLSNQNL